MIMISTVIEEHPNLGPKARNTNTNPLLVDFACYPWDRFTDECYGDGNTTEGFCSDNYRPDDPAFASEGRLRRLTEERRGGYGAEGDAGAGATASLMARAAETFVGAASASQDLGRRLYAVQHAAKVKGASLAAVSGEAIGTGSFSGGLYTVMLHEHEVAQYINTYSIL